MRTVDDRYTDETSEARSTVRLPRARRWIHIRATGRRAAMASLVAALAFGSGLVAAEADEPGELAKREMRHIASTFPGRMARTPQEDAAAQCIADRLLEMGYRSTLDQFRTSYTFTWTKKPSRVHDYRLLTSTNVIAEKRGTSGKRIIVGAHYDSRTPQSDTDLARNGHGDQRHPGP